jgi:tetratricopeptide (TPR) repeat protein
LLRTAAEITQNKALSDKWFPVVFSEDNYGICTPGEFWLEALNRAGEKTGNNSLKKGYQSLCSESNEDRLQEGALSLLMAFSDQQKKRLLLVVENLPLLFDPSFFSKTGLKLYQSLHSEPRIKLLTSLTSTGFPMKTTDKNDNKALELFKTVYLESLNTDDCVKLCRYLTTQSLDWHQVRPLQILTDGNPRRLMVMADYFLNSSDHDLKKSFIRFIDDNTAYFKNRLENLPSQERKVLIAVATKWQPVTAREIAETSRLNVNLVSAHLQRLLAKGEVVVADQKGRRKWYRIIDRTYNAVILIRRGGQSSDRIYGAVDFMDRFYKGLHETNGDTADTNTRQTDIQIDTKDASSRAELGQSLSKESSRLVDAEKAFQRAIEIEPDDSSGWNQLITFQIERALNEKKALETVAAYLNFFNRSAQSLNNIAWLFFERGYKNYLDSAESWSLEAIGKDKENLPYYYHTLISILGAMGRWKESISTSEYFLKDSGFVQKEIGEIIEYFITAAAAGHGADGLLILEQHPSIAILEPLIAGMKMYLGETVMTAHEIREIGQDIADRIVEKKRIYHPF